MRPSRQIRNARSAPPNKALKSLRRLERPRQRGRGSRPAQVFDQFHIGHNTQCACPAVLHNDCASTPVYVMRRRYDWCALRQVGFQDAPSDVVAEATILSVAKLWRLQPRRNAIALMPRKLQYFLDPNMMLPMTTDHGGQSSSNRGTLNRTFKKADIRQECRPPQRHAIQPCLALAQIIYLRPLAAPPGNQKIQKGLQDVCAARRPCTISLGRTKRSYRNCANSGAMRAHCFQMIATKTKSFRTSIAI